MALLLTLVGVFTAHAAPSLPSLNQMLSEVHEAKVTTPSRLIAKKKAKKAKGKKPGKAKRKAKNKAKR